MQIDLTVRRKSDGNSYTITCDLLERAIFGRSIASPAHLEGSEISREHFALLSQDGSIYVEDLSSNGTRVNGKAIPQAKPKKVKTGDVLEVPGYEIEVGRRVPALEEEAEQPPAQQEPQPPQPVVVKQAKPVSSDTSLSVWEMVIIAGCVASLGLIVYYFGH